MDEVLFQIPELIDYSVRITEGKKEITALFTSDNGKEQIRKVYPDGDIFSLNCKKQNGRAKPVSGKTCDPAYLSFRELLRF